MRQIFFVLIFLVAAGQAAVAGKDDLIIRTATGLHGFSIELADTPESRANGLMYRTSLPADAGMLFDFGAVAPVVMWMKNTLIPLDMLFVRKDGTIAAITERTVPESLTLIESTEPVLAVFEINGGSAARLGIRAGDKLLHPLFAKSP